MNSNWVKKNLLPVHFSYSLSPAYTYIAKEPLIENKPADSYKVCLQEL